MVLVDNYINYFLRKLELGSVVKEKYSKYERQLRWNAVKNILNSNLEEIEKVDRRSEKAADWWCEVLLNPRFDMGGKDKNAGLAECMASLSNNLQTQNLEVSVEKFRHYLIEQIKLGFYNDQTNFKLEVDYHPNLSLIEAAKKAEYHGLFPWKTAMTFTNGDVNVYYGLNSNRKTIYSAHLNPDERTKKLNSK